MKKTILLLFAALLLSAPAFASGGGAHIEEQEWPHKGAFGTFDKAALQRGFQVYKEVCASCHSLKFLSYRNLEALGYTEEQVKAIAAEYEVTDGPDETGGMFERPARPSDRFKSPFPNDAAARMANGGALPPDLSLVVKARPHGEDYIHALLTGYEDAPAEMMDAESGEMTPFTMGAGMSFNKVFPGHQIAMAPPLTDGRVSYGDGTEATVEQQSRDVVQFLAWAAEPHQDERKQMGVKVVLYLLAFAAVMYGVKRKIWSGLH